MSKGQCQSAFPPRCAPVPAPRLEPLEYCRFQFPASQTTTAGIVLVISGQLPQSTATSMPGSDHALKSIPPKLLAFPERIGGLSPAGDNELRCSAESPLQPATC